VTGRGLCLTLLVTAAAACGGKPPPNGPDPLPPDLTGTWTGPASDSSGPGTMTWTLTKSSSGASGQAVTRTPLGSVVLTGTVAITQSGTSANWTIDVPAGGVLGEPACTVKVTGTATVSPAAIAGTYSGTGSCTAPFSDGTITLSKQ
jgi:hypothetical protein